MRSCWYLVLTTGLAVGVYVVIGAVLKPCAWYAGTEMVLVGLLVTMVMLLSLYWEPRTNEARFNWRTAVILGFVQALALLPGISRFASTYVTARFLHCASRRAFETSFLIQLPLLIIAFLINGVRGFAKHPMPELCTISLLGLIGVATVLAYICFWLMWKLALERRLWIMGLYMPVPISIVLYFLAK
jgi:undecaprenyl-diphosphatase